MTAIEVSEKESGVLERALKYENSLDPETFTLGWHWHEVGAHTATLTNLVVKQLVKISYKSNNDTCYILTDEGKILAEGGTILKEEPAPVVQGQPSIALDSMFSDITGHDDIKELLYESLQLKKPIHVLLVGPPSLAKSMFLWGIERVYGDDSLPLIGSATSHAGLWDLLAEKRPRIVLIDEIEKMTLADQAGLLALMEQGRLIRAKVGRKLDERLTVWVIAAANRTSKMSAELLSRFARFDLTEYTATEFRSVVTSVLVTHEDTSYDVAAEISTRLLGKTSNVRDAIRVARLAKGVGVKRAAELLIRR